MAAIATEPKFRKYQRVRATDNNAEGVIHSIIRDLGGEPVYHVVFIGYRANLYGSELVAA